MVSKDDVDLAARYLDIAKNLSNVMEIVGPDKRRCAVAIRRLTRESLDLLGD